MTCPNGALKVHGRTPVPEAPIAAALVVTVVVRAAEVCLGSRFGKMENEEATHLEHSMARSHHWFRWMLLLLRVLGLQQSVGEKREWTG